MEAKLRESVCNYLVEQCQKEEVARKLVNHAFEQLRENMNALMYKMAKGALHAVRESVIEQANQMLVTKGAEYVGSYIDQVYLEWMDKPVCEVVMLIEEKVPDAKQMLWEQYERTVRDKATQFVSAFNVAGIIEERIEAYDLAQLEQMIMEISSKELHALVWLGGLLGVLMGFVNLLF